MELTLYTQGKKLDIETSKFEINLTSFNPLTFEDATRKYTSSIKLPRSHINDSVFYAYRYPGAIPRERIIIEAYIDGLLVDSFRATITVNKDSYSINLVPLTNSIDNGEEFKLSNNINMPYFQRDNRFINVGKLVKMLYPSFYNTSSTKVESLIMPSFEYLELPKTTDVDPVLIENNYVTGDYRNLDMRLKVADNKINDYFTDPDQFRRLRIVTTGSIVFMSDKLNSSSVIYLRMHNKFKVKLSYVGMSHIYPIFQVPSFGMDLDVTDKVDMIIECELPYVRMIHTMKFEVSVSFGDIPIVINYNIGIKKKYELLKGYCTADMCMPYSNNNEIAKMDMLSTEMLDWSDKFVSLISIKEATGASSNKIMRFGDREMLLIKDDSIIASKNELTQILPLKTNGDLPTTVALGAIASEVTIYDYYNGDGYKDAVGEIIDPFLQQTEYECNMNLTIFDIVNFNQSKRVYIDELHSYFYVIAVSGWSTDTGSCKVKLLKLI